MALKDQQSDKVENIRAEEDTEAHSATKIRPTDPKKIRILRGEAD
jgi:hypothetical protein